VTNNNVIVYIEKNIKNQTKKETRPKFYEEQRCKLCCIGVKCGR